MSFDLRELYEVCYSILMLVTPILCYTPQYRLMKANQSVGTFSVLICYFFLLSNSLKMVFWTGEQFSIFILIQSLIIIVMQSLILYTYFDIKQRNHDYAMAVRFYHKGYNRHEDLFSLIFSRVLSFFPIYLFIFTFLMNKPLIQTTGIMTSVLDTFTAVPQCVNNFRNKSVESLR